MLPEPDLFRNTTSSSSHSHSHSHDTLSHGTNIEDVESLHSGQVENGQGCQTHTVATLSLPRNKLKLVSSSNRSAPVYSKIFNTGTNNQGTGSREERNTRRWYLIVIVLLYVGLLTSFSLNVSLLIRRDPHLPPPTQVGYPEHNLGWTLEDSPGKLQSEKDGQIVGNSGTEFAYTTACLVQDPCPAGSFYSCPLKQCLACPMDSYQPQWGQTSCWPCPNSTHTDRPGAETAALCKQSECGRFSRPDLAVLQSPNYPAEFPSSSTCHWKVRPAAQHTSLIIIPHISLPPLCTHTVSIRSLVEKGGGTILETCKSSEEPIILTAEASAIYVDFSGKGNLTAEGFQISIVSVTEELSQVMDAVLSTDWDRTRQVLGYNHKEERLVSRLLSLLSPGLRRDKARKQKNKPLIEVVEDGGSQRHDEGGPGNDEAVGGPFIGSHQGPFVSGLGERTEGQTARHQSFRRGGNWDKLQGGNSQNRK